MELIIIILISVEVVIVSEILLLCLDVTLKFLAGKCLIRDGPELWSMIKNTDRTDSREAVKSHH